MRTIDTEHHFTTPLYMETLNARTTVPRVIEGKGLAYWEDAIIPIGKTGAGPKLADMGEGRIKAMDAAGVDFAVLSLTAPGVEPFDPPTATKVARDANDRLAEYIAAYPDRLAGMATLSVKEPAEAVSELERCVKELGFQGWHTHSNFGDSYLDEKRYWPVLEAAEALDVPVYLHPTAPMIPELRSFGICLAGPTFGFGTEVMYVFLRMIHRGVFDEFPKLKVILGPLRGGDPLPARPGGHRVPPGLLRAERGCRPGQQGVGQLLRQEQPVGDVQRQLPARRLLLHPGRPGSGQDRPGHRLPVRADAPGHRLHQGTAHLRRREGTGLRGQRRGAVQAVIGGVLSCHHR